MKKIAILLTVFNRKETTLRSLRNLYKQKIPNEIELAVYIVEGGSNDGTVEAVKKNYPTVNIKVINGLFWNRGMYKAWEWAASCQNYDFYLWLNDDTFLVENAINQLLISSECNHNRAIIVGATASTTDKNVYTYGGRLKDGSIAPINGVDTEVYHFNGNIVLVTSYVYGALGNLDYYFTHSKGDYDYGLRAYAAGIKMYQCGEILGHCDTHESIDKWCDPKVPFKKRWWWMNRPNGMPPREQYHFLVKHGNKTKAVVYYLMIYIRCICPWLWTITGKAKVG